jgi:Phosphate-induced protein 1 conserved region
MRKFAITGVLTMNQNASPSVVRCIRLSLILGLMFVCCFSLVNAQSRKQAAQAPAVMPTTNFNRTVVPFAATGNGIEYHGGPVMLNAHNVYFIWYGNWTGNTATTILPAFISGLSNSPYFSINTTFENGSNQNMSTTVNMAGQSFDSYSGGTTLSDAGVQTVVSRALNNGSFPRDTNGVYFVLTSADVNESNGFCTSFCGWHNHATLGGSDIKYAFVGNADRCPASCISGLNQTNGPNDNRGADGMANVMAHELSEASTDPDLNAWFHINTEGENSDLCNFNMGATFTAPNGTQANVSLGGRNFLIQQNWLNDGGGGCTIASTGNPFKFTSARDEFLTCFGIAGAIVSNCDDVSDANDRQICRAVSTSTQTACSSSMTDRNLQLSCFGISIAPSFPSNCRDITNPQMQAFCYGVSSRGGNPPPNCSNVTDPDTRALCNGMALQDSTQCNSISNTNDRLFCQGVSSHNNSFCSTIQ